MNESSRIFLDNNRHHYELLMRAGIVKHLDNATREGLLNVIRTEFDRGYLVNLWCGECVVTMLKYAYVQYDRWREKQVVVAT